MANQTISVSANHDDKTGRLAGEDFTITSGATLTLDSMPHLTAMGILGDITISDGTLHIDGRYAREVTYSSGTGTLPVVGAAASWTGGTGKVIRLNSGDNASGTMTITRQTGVDPTGTITDGTWSATVDSSKNGFLIVYGEDQDWGSVDGRSSLIINGDWYEVGVGDGTDSQTLELPHTGHQPCIWVETGNGTGVFDKWFRVVPSASIIFYNNISQFGATYESGFVFDQTFGDATVTFGTSTAGGVPPSGARIRIPNVHIGTTTTAAPTTEVNSATFASHIGVVAPNTNLNVAIDHLNGSSCYVDFRGTNAVTVSDSCWGLSTTAALLQKVNAAAYFDNVAIVDGSHGVAGCYLPAVTTGVIDNLGGITFNNCLIYAGNNANNNGGLVLTTMANIAFTGVNKLVPNQQDENTCYALRGLTASNGTAETLICLGGQLGLTTGANNWEVDELIYGLPPGRGTTEQNMGAIAHTASKGLIVHSGRLASGAKHGTVQIVVCTDSDTVTVRNFGEIDAKIDGEARCTGIVNLAGISSNITLQRMWYTNCNTTQVLTMLNSVADITIENCSTDYNDEIELDGNRVIAKGIHGASGAPDASTGVEGDNTNCIATIFLDYFKSDTTGAIGLNFNDRGVKHLNDVEIVSGTPSWNGLCDLLMRTTGDQVIYTWPYSIKGHTGFQNAAIQAAGVNHLTNHSYEYSVDTGSGWTAWATANGANLSAETISPAGFKFKLRITCTTAAATNAIKGFAALTTTTIADQKANLYDLDVNTVTFTGLPTGCDVVVLVAGTSTILDQKDQLAGTTYSYTYSGAQSIDIGFIKPGYVPYYVRNLALTTTDSSIPVTLTPDRNYQ